MHNCISTNVNMYVTSLPNFRRSPLNSLVCIFTSDHSYIPLSLASIPLTLLKSILAQITEPQAHSLGLLLFVFCLRTTVAQRVPSHCPFLSLRECLNVIKTWSTMCFFPLLVLVAVLKYFLYSATLPFEVLLRSSLDYYMLIHILKFWIYSICYYCM